MGELYRNSVRSLSNTNDVLLYTCPAYTKAVVNSAVVTNKDAAARSIRLKVTDFSASQEAFLAYDQSVQPASQSEPPSLIRFPIVLEEGDTLVIKAGTANVFDVALNLVEVSSQIADEDAGAFLSWHHTGVTNQTVFSISGASVASARAYVVTVNGVTVESDEYTIDAAADTLTFAVAPANDADIEIRCLAYTRSVLNALQIGNNLSDLANVSAARTNLGLGTMATASAADYLPLAGGTMTGPITLHSSSLLKWGGTASFPALKRSSTELQVRLADDSGYAPLRTGTLIVDNGNLLVPYGEVQFNGASWVFDTAYQMRAAPYARIQWVPSGNWFGYQDTELGRAGVGTLGIWNKDNLGCALKVHGTYNDGSNYVRASLAATSTAVTLAAETAGTGQDDISIEIKPAGGGYIGLGYTGYDATRPYENSSYGPITLGLGVASTASTTTTSEILRLSRWGTIGSKNNPAASFAIGCYAASSSAKSRLDLLLTETSGAPNITVMSWLANGLVAFGDATSSYPALKRSSTKLQVRLADDSGWANIAAGEYEFADPNIKMQWSGSNVVIPYVWSLYYVSSGTSGQTRLYGDDDGWGTHVFAQRNGTNAQTFRVYGSYTDASNYVRASLAATSTSVTLAAETAGTGADNVDVNITPAGTGSVNLGSKAMIGTATLSHDGLATLSIDSVIAQNATHFTFYANRAGAGTWAGMDGFAVRDSSFYAFSNSGQWYGTIDLALARNAAGVAEINNGTPGTYRDLKLRTLYGEGGTVTASAPVLDISQTWNNAAVAFQGARIKITDTASQPKQVYSHGSMPFVITDGSDNVMSGFGRDGCLWFGGWGYSTTRLYRTSSGGVTVLDCSPFGGGNGGFEVFGGIDFQYGALINPLGTYPTAGFSFGLSNRLGYAANAAQQFWFNDGTIHQRNGNVAQTYYIYGAYTDASNYVRASLAATSTSVTLAAQTAGTGADDVNLVLSAAGTGYVSITQSSNVGLALKLTGINYGGGNSPNAIFLIDGYSASPVTTTNALFSVSGAGHVGIDTSWFNANQYVANSLTINGVYGFRVAADVSTFSIHSDYGGNNLDQLIIHRQSGNMVLMSGGGMLGIGGLTSSFPALKRNSTELQVRLADDSGYATTAAGCFTSHGSQSDPQGNGNWMLRHRNSDGGAYWGFSQKNGGSNDIGVFIAGTLTSAIGYKFEAHNTNGGLGWSSSPGAAGPNLVIVRDTTDVVAIYGTTNAALRLYGAYTDGSNFVRASLAATSTSVTLAAETAGTGADNIDLNLVPAGTGQTVVTSLYAHRDFSTAYSYGKMIQVTGDEGRTATFGTVSGQPAIAFGSDLTTNFAANGYIYGHSGCLQFVGGGNNIRFWNSIEIGYPATFYVATGGGVITRNYLAICDSAAAATDGADVVLRRDAANILALRNGSNGQKLRVYGDYTGASQYCALEMSCTQTGGDYFSHYIGPVNAGGSDYWSDNHGTIGGWAFLTIAANSHPSSPDGFGAVFFRAAEISAGNVNEGGYNFFFDGRGSAWTGYSGHKNFFYNPNTASHTLGLWQPNGHTKSALTVYTNSVLKADITSAGAFRSYGAWTDDSNYVRASLSAAASSVTLAAETAGTGADDVDVSINPAGAGRVYFLSNGLQLDSYGTGVRLFGVSYIQNNSAPIRILCGASDGIAVLDTGGVTIDNPVSPDTVATLKLNARGTQLAPLFNAGGFTVNGTGTFVTFGHQNSASYPALKRSSTELQVRLADDSGYAPFRTATLNIHGELQFPASTWIIRAGGAGYLIGYENDMLLYGGKFFSLGSTGANYADCSIGREAAGVLAQRNDHTGAALVSQTFRIYGARTDDSNYVRASLAATSTSVTLAAETAGTGADDVDVNVTAAGNGGIVLNTEYRVALNGSSPSSHYAIVAPGVNVRFTQDAVGSYTQRGFAIATDGVWRFAVGDNTISKKIGIQSDYLLGWVSGNVTSTNPTLDTGLGRNAAGVVEVNNGTPGTYRDLALRTLLLRSTAAPGAPVNGDLWLDTAQKTLSYYAAGVAQTVNGVLFTQTQTVTVANTVTETALTGTGTGTLTLPANFFAAGKTIKIRALGYHSSTGSPNITIRVKLGSTTILTTGAVTSGNGSDDAWVCDAFVTCRTVGGSGTVIGQGYYEEVHGNGSRAGMVNTATTTVDTTASQAISITVEWGTAAAGNTISCTNILIEVLN